MAMRAESAADVAIVGGGVAGLAVAYLLAQAGVSRVVLLEREPMLATHATAKNAAIFLPVERDEVSMRLAVRQAALLDALCDGRAWLDPRGALLVAEESVLLAPVAAAARAGGLACGLLDHDALRNAAPVLRGGRARAALHVPTSGVLDTAAMVSALATRAREGGTSLRTVQEARRIRVERGRVVGVELSDGAWLAAEHVVLAGGAWSESLAAASDLALPLVALRRHLAWLAAPPELPDVARGPVVWAVDDEVYFRGESGGVLASPCDEESQPPGVPAVDPDALESLARKLSVLAPRLADMGVRRAWSCLRTFAPDRVAVAGADPRVAGLSWLAGLGGQGMTLGVATAEITCASVLGTAHPLAAALGPARLLGGDAGQRAARVAVPPGAAAS
jgi:sarcosine oxidase subunit beta